MIGKRYVKLRVILLSLASACLFSMSAFAEPYTGAYWGYDETTGTYGVMGSNPTNQVFSGENKIEMNAYNNAPVLTGNTFNGSTEIDTNFTDITSNSNEYNGRTTIDVGLGGTLNSSNDTLSNTSLNASQSDVSINNGTFNGSTTINANNITLGSVPQMSDLLDYIQILIWNLSYSIVRTDGVYTYTHNLNSGGTYTQYLIGTYEWTISYSDSGAVFTSSNVACSLAGFLNVTMNNVRFLLRYLLEFLIHARQYPMWNFVVDGEFYNITEQTYTTSFFQMVENRLSILCSLFSWFCNRFYNWYYPLDNVVPMYWQYYNTDTKQAENIGLGGLMYNISWYLGQLYVLQSASAALDDAEEAASDLNDALTSYEQSEQAVISSISSGIQSFVPDVSELGSFKALAWCSNYLQQVYVSLGMYGTVILIGLLLGVCMQFIGYFRYK